MKRKLFNLSLIALAGLLVSACSSPEKMVDAANLVQKKCEPVVLEAKANVIDARYTLTFPEKYFHPKAILEVVPVLMYDGGEETGASKWLQGEDVTDNYTVVPKTGGSVAQVIQFDYKPGMEKAVFELRVKLHYKGKAVPFALPFKMADGTNTTYMLVEKMGAPIFAVDAFQKTYVEEREARILYPINSATIRQSELTKEEVKSLEAFLTEVKNDPKKEAKATSIVAYSSPEGPTTLNEKLSTNRGKAAKDALARSMRRMNNQTPVEVSSVSEDWDGFRELVSGSSIADRELILRVLSMYSDPVVREREIKNMSKVYQILADKILPDLRRARIIAQADVTNYSNSELNALVAGNNLDELDIEALLYAASIENDLSTKIMIYNKAAQKFNDWRAYNNLACAYLAQDNNIADAKAAMSKIVIVNEITKNNNGVIALREGRMDDAAKLFGEASSFAQARQNLGIVLILNGHYTEAAKQLESAGNFNEALANVLVNNNNKASDILKNLSSGKARYLNAVIAAREGNSVKVAIELQGAYSSDSALRTRAQKDIEFAKVPSSI